MVVFAVVLCGMVPLPARAVTQNIQNSGATWTPAYIHASPGDVITWTVNPGATHNITQYAGDGSPYFKSPEMASGTFSQPFNGGSVWYRCTHHSTLTTQTGCSGMCGGYSTLPSATPPVVTAPLEGGQLNRNTVTFSGTADPWDLITITEGTNAMNKYALGDGTWSLSGYFKRGDHTVTVAAKTAAGDSAAVTRAFTVLSDPNGPLVVFTTRAPGPVGTALPLTGQVADESSVVGVSVKPYDITGHPVTQYPYRATCACPTPPNQVTTWTWTPPPGFTPGVYELWVGAADEWGNSGIAKATFIVIV